MNNNIIVNIDNTNLSGGFNQEALHEYKRRNQEFQIVELNKSNSKLETGLMIASLVVMVGFGFILATTVPFGGATAVAYLSL